MHTNLRNQKWRLLFLHIMIKCRCSWYWIDIFQQRWKLFTILVGLSVRPSVLAIIFKNIFRTSQSLFKYLVPCFLFKIICIWSVVRVQRSTKEFGYRKNGVWSFSFFFKCNRIRVSADELSHMPQFSPFWQKISLNYQFFLFFHKYIFIYKIS